MPKTFKIILSIILFHIHATHVAMEHQSRVKYHIQQASLGGAIIGGWGFFIVNAQSVTHKLSYPTKRAPLALFLTSCSINHGLVMHKNYHSFKHINNVNTINNKE